MNAATAEAARVALLASLTEIHARLNLLHADAHALGIHATFARDAISGACGHVVRASASLTR